MTSADVTVAEVIEVARRKRALLTPETAGYLVLEAADQLVASPVLVDEHLCSMQVEGGRVSMLSRRVAHPLDAERGLRQLLRRLLDVSSGRAPALNSVASLPPKGDLAGLLTELESALIPVNRGAASRALSRLARETIRERRPSVAPGEGVPGAELEHHVESVPPGPADDTEPMQLGIDVGPVFDMSRDSQETLNRHVTLPEPSLPRFPLDSAGDQGRASDAFGFVDEATTARRQTIEPRPAQPLADNVQDLLDDCLPSDPPPAIEVEPAALPPPTPPPPAVARVVTPRPGAVLPAPTPPPPPTAPLRTPPPAATKVTTPAPGAVLPVPTPAPPAVSSKTPPVAPPKTPLPAAVSPLKTPAPAAAVPLPSPTPPPAALPAVATAPPSAAARSAAPPTSAVSAPTPLPKPSHGPAREPIFSSFPPSSARGVDELLQDFLSKTSRKQDRVAQDLRKMAGVDAETKREATDNGSDENDESPFPHAGGATDFYTSTPPPRAAVSVAPDHSHDRTAGAPKGRGVYAVFAIVMVVALGGIALLRLEPGFLSGRTPSVVEEERRVAAEATSALVAHPPQVCRATLVVADVPPGAEVLVRSGLAPVDVERVPSGARLEFVALTDGYAPRRGIVPQGAAWDALNGRPRFELPIQLEKSRAKPGALDPWPAAEPGSVVGGQGAPGTVHVVTSPRGAEVWMVAGGAPEAKLEALPCGAALELMIAGVQQGQQPLRRRLRVEAPRLTPEPSASAVTARISATK